MTEIREGNFNLDGLGTNTVVREKPFCWVLRLDGGGGGNRTRIQRLRPVNSTRLAHLLYLASGR